MLRLIITCAMFLVSLISSAQITMRRVATLPDELNEISGIQYVKNDFWAINDGGNASKLYQIDTFGNIVKSFIVQAQNVDWEDICTDGDSLLFIGDFGNNDNNRTNLAIYKVNITKSINDTFYPQKIDFSYSDQKDYPPSNNLLQFDCEAFIYYRDTFHFFSKNRTSPFDGWVKHYTLPINNQNGIAQLIDSFKLGGFLKELFWVTSAAIHSKENRLLLLSSDKIYQFTKFTGSDFFKGEFSTISLGDISQKEGICFDPIGNIWISDEANNGPAGLYTINEPRLAHVNNKGTHNLKAFFLHDSSKLIIEPKAFPGRLTITDISGSLIFQNGIGKSQTLEISTVDWPKGVYLLNYSTNEENFVTKIKIY